MCNRTYFAVETRHPVKGSRWNGQHTFQVSRDSGADRPSYYASSAHFGCGKTQPTPEQAIYHLANDNGAEVLNLCIMYEDETQKIAELIRNSDDLDLAFVLELWEILRPDGPKAELEKFLQSAGF